MPKLGHYSPLLQSVFFLYRTKEDAELGINFQGTGFLVAVPSIQWPDYCHIHGITNWHVAIDYLPAPCIRINTYQGKPEIFDFDPSEWIHQPDGYDVAISPPLKLDSKIHIFSPLDINSFFLTTAEEKADEIGPADDVFMIGRFTDYHGAEVNDPALRFGHISVMDAKIKQLTGYFGRSIMLDMNSRSGFSGSPVFIYRTLGSHFIEQALPGQFLAGGGHYIKLLGMHWGQFNEQWELKKKISESKTDKNSLVVDGKYIIGLSGMTCTIPASCIAEVLNLPETQDLRTETNYYRPPQKAKTL